MNGKFIRAIRWRLEHWPRDAAGLDGLCSDDNPPELRQACHSDAVTETVVRQAVVADQVGFEFDVRRYTQAA